MASEFQPDKKVISLKEYKIKLINQAFYTLTESELAAGAAVCALCGYGLKNRWYPLLSSTRCPMCGSSKRRLNHIVSANYCSRS
jgi:hypothetical protein